MAEAQGLPTFAYLGTLEQSLYLTAQVARHPDSEQLLLVNRISHCEKTRPFFRDLYEAFLHRPERSDFQEMFSVHQEFYAVFRYHEGPSIQELYAGRPGAAGKRLRLLIAALFQVYTAAGALPAPVLCSLLQPENLIVDEEERIRLRYLIYPEYFLNEASCDPWQETAALMEFLMGKELKKAYHKTLRAIYKKCVAGLYPSLPAMINDLEKAAEVLPDTGPVQALRAYVLRKKARIAQISWIGMVTLFACLVVYLITGVTGRSSQEVIPISDIGTITYVAAQDEEEDSMQLADPPADNGEQGVSFSGLPGPAAELDSEDYVVQSGDTLSSICVHYYGAAAYGELVASFNGLPADEALEAGTVLRLPLQDQLARYLEN